MAVKLADTLAPMGDFEVAEAKDVSVDIKGTKKMLQKAIEDGDIGGGVEIDDTSTDATDKTWSTKKIVDTLLSFLQKEDIIDGIIRKITMDDGVEITSTGNGLHLQYSDNEIDLKNDDLILHNIAGGESRVSLKDGSLMLEGAPYWDRNPAINMVGGENEDLDRSRIDMYADDINLKGKVKVNDQVLGKVTNVITAVGAYRQNEGNYLTSKELWNAGVRGGTYLIHAHSNSSNSSCLFWGFIDFNGEGDDFNDYSFGAISGTKMWCDYRTNRLYYTGGDIGSICTMDFIMLSPYIDN